MSRRSLSISWFSNKLHRALLNTSRPFDKAGKRGCVSRSRLAASSSPGSIVPQRSKIVSHVSGIIVTVFLVPALLISGCGYRFSPAGEHIDKNIRTVFIDTFSNRTSEAFIENTFRSAFIDQFIIGGRFKLVDSRDKADAIFKGAIVSLTTSPLSYQRSNVAAEERLTVTMELTFEEQENKKLIWNNTSFSGYQDYASPDLSSKETNRRNAFTKLSTDTAEKAYRTMMSGF